MRSRLACTLALVLSGTGAFAQGFTQDEVNALVEARMKPMLENAQVVAFATKCGVLDQDLGTRYSRGWNNNPIDQVVRQFGAQWNNPLVVLLRQAEQTGRDRATPSRCAELRRNPALTAAIKQHVIETLD